jgi:hypothetical protein
MRVTENLEAALYFIRDTLDLAGAGLKVWIDAICIQQTDQDEKIYEIRRMKSIYGGSLGVIVHLGPQREDTDLAVDSLKRIASQVYDRISEGKDSPPLSRENTSESTRKLYISLVRLFCQPYWRRLWILQELAMSDANTTFGYGARSFQFNELHLTSKFVWHNIEMLELIIGDAAELNFPTMNSSMWVIMFVEELWKLSQRLEDAQPVTYANIQLPLNLSKNGRAKLIHDKVFGLLAILPPAVGLKMEPFYDYSLPSYQIFTEFTKSIIAATGDLGIICMRNQQQKMAPSWATDWQFEPDRATLLHKWQKYGYRGFNNAYPNLEEMIEAGHRLRADRSWKPDMAIRFQGQTLLHCTGIRIGTVDGIASGIRAAHEEDQDSFVPVAHMQPRHDHNPYGDDTATRRALAHTLCGNPVWGDQAESALLQIPWITDKDYLVDGVFTGGDLWRPNMERMCEKGWRPLFSYGYYNSFEVTRHILGGFHIAGKPFREWFAQDIVEMDMPPDRVFLDLAKFVGNQLGRRLATMNTGHFCLIPNAAVRGDCIYIIPGCPFPVLLRPCIIRHPYYQVVGECYVEGFAKGEAIDGLDARKYELEHLTLC